MMSRTILWKSLLYQSPRGQRARASPAYLKAASSSGKNRIELLPSRLPNSHRRLSRQTSFGYLPSSGNKPYPLCPYRRKRLTCGFASSIVLVVYIPVRFTNNNSRQGGRMVSHLKVSGFLAIAALFLGAGISAQAQDQRHVVSLSELNKDAAQAAQTRQSDEGAVRTLLSSEQGQKALKSAHLDYQSVDKAVGQLSDDDLARLAQRSLQAQADFAAGRLSNGAIIAIVAVIAATIILASVFYALSKD